MENVCLVKTMFNLDILVNTTTQKILILLTQHIAQFSIIYNGLLIICGRFHFGSSSLVLQQHGMYYSDSLII